MKSSKFLGKCLKMLKWPKLTIKDFAYKWVLGIMTFAQQKHF
jgi:hypothetical protein